MYKILLFVFSLLIISGFSSCTTTRVVVVNKHPHGMPPGQAKKFYRSKSAKPYAHGHVKKKKH